MQRPDVQTLVAYANGELTPAEARRIEHFLNGNSEARRLIAEYRRTAVRDEAPSKAPKREAPPRQPAHPAKRLPRSAGAEGSARQSGMARWTMRVIAVAAIVAIGAALGFGPFMAGREGDGPIAPGRLSTIDTLSSALTRLASGSPDMAGDRAVTVLTTFRDAARRPCRQFEISETSPTAPRIVAIACLDGRAWQIEGSAWLEAGVSAAGGGSALADFGADDPLARPLKRLGTGAALGAEEEAALIARNWEDGGQ